MAHFARFFEYMEQAEHAFLRHVDLSVMMEHDGAVLSWPRVSAKCDFASPVRFEDLLDIDLTITRIGNRSVTYQLDFTCRGQRTANGQLTTVCCRLDPAPVAIPIPAEIAQRLAPYVVQTE